MSLTAFFRKDRSERVSEEASTLSKEAGTVVDAVLSESSGASTSTDSAAFRKAAMVGGGIIALAYFATRKAGSGAPVPSPDEVKETVPEANEVKETIEGVREDPASVVPVEGSDESESDGETAEGGDEEEEDEEIEVETEIEIEAGEGVEVEVEAETELDREGENELEVESEVEVEAHRSDDEEEDEVTSDEPRTEDGEEPREQTEAESAVEHVDEMRTPDDEEDEDETAVTDGEGGTRAEASENPSGEERTSEEVQERLGSDVESESPEPGEMNVDDDVVEGVVDGEDEEE